uniref:Uncharacterized protein n=1 Tax=Knipowitschia caucasica TaxID=637954 RepID=A0AAV2KFF6_KNICA
MRDYQDLHNVKMSLEIEINHPRRKLIEGEEDSRLSSWYHNLSRNGKLPISAIQQQPTFSSACVLLHDRGARKARSES